MSHTVKAAVFDPAGFVAPVTTTPPKDAAATVPAPARGNLIQVGEQRAFDAKRAANVLKVLSSLAAASVDSGASPEDLLIKTETLALAIIGHIGVDQDSETADKLLPMFMHSASKVVADFARTGGNISDKKVFDKFCDAVEKSMIGSVKSGAIRKMAEAAYPGEIEIAEALRVSTLGALVDIAIEVEYFDFGVGKDTCIKQAGASVIKAVRDLLPQFSSGMESRDVLTMMMQSMVRNATSLYTAVWRSTASKTCELDVSKQREAFATIDLRFYEQFCRVMKHTSEIVPEVVAMGHFEASEMASVMANNVQSSGIRSLPENPPVKVALEVVASTSPAPQKAKLQR